MAIEWKHELRDAVTETHDEQGEVQFVFDPDILDYFLQTLTHLTRNGGAYIRDDEERTDIEKKTRQLIQLLEIVREYHENDLEVLLRTAYAYGIGYSLSFPDSMETTIRLYKQAHAIQPDSALTNFLLGMFMFGTKEHNLDSASYLEKALEKGIESCRFTLGMLYIRQNKNDIGKEYLKKYAEDNPDNKHAQLVWDAVRRGDINMQNSQSTSVH